MDDDFDKLIIKAAFVVVLVIFVGLVSYGFYSEHLGKKCLIELVKVGVPASEANVTCRGN